MSRTMCLSAKDYFESMGRVLEAIKYEPVDALVDLLVEIRKKDQQVFVFGNGGSASTSGHFLLELIMMGQSSGLKGMQARSLTDNMGLLTALANDISYEDVFRYQLVSYAKPGDVAVAISGSGNSPNVLLACRWAKEHKLTVAGLTGFDGGRLKDLSDIHINIPSNNFGIIEDLHMSIGHIVGQRLHRIISDSE